MAIGPIHGGGNKLRISKRKIPQKTNVSDGRKCRRNHGKRYANGDIGRTTVYGNSNQKRIARNNYSIGGNMAYTNSPLVTYTKISPNKTSPRNHVIDTITVHCYVGQVTAERGCNASRFIKKDPQNGASCNYVIGYDGSIGLCVEEKDRSWCSSNRDNDQRAVTIETASAITSPYVVTDEAMAALINLITDICIRNGKTKILWLGDKDKTLAYEPKAHEIRMTVHRWFKDKSCPGDYLYGKHSYIAEEVNKRIKKYTPANDNAPQFPDSGNEILVAEKRQSISSDVRSVQEWLNIYYGTEIAADGIFGAKTKAALVKAWQMEIGNLVVDGLFGPACKAAAAKNNIKKGSTGLLTTIWQAYLVCMGYNPNGIDGKFGSGCAAATIAFQKKNGLAQDGVVGSNTWYAALH